MSNHDQAANICTYKNSHREQCSRQREKGREFCIFHDPILDKDNDRFMRELQADFAMQTISPNSSILDISGFHIPFSFNIENHIGRYITKLQAHNTKFYKDLNFFRRKFDGELDFTQAIFSKINFEDVGVKDIYFTNAAFKNEANFKNMTVTNISNFNSANFDSDVSFEDTDFNKAHFIKVRFGEEPSNEDLDNYFINVKFNEEVDFSYAEFNNNVIFRKVHFNKGDFNMAAFNKLADFSSSTIEGTFNKTEFNSETIFNKTNISRVEFKNTSLTKCLFSNSIGLENCLFSHVWWSDSSYRGWKLADQLKICTPQKYKSKVYGERDASSLTQRLIDTLSNLPWHHLPSISSLATVERAYRELRVNYEKHGNFADAGKFHYGEMQMRRFALRRKRFFSLYFFYWLFSGYGEKWKRAFLWFTSTLLIGALIYRWQGFAIKLPFEEQTGKAQISYDFLQSIILSFKVSIFRTDVFSQAVTNAGRITMLIQTIISPILLALLILSISRQFKRN